MYLRLRDSCITPLSRFKDLPGPVTRVKRKRKKPSEMISLKVFLKSFCRSKFPHKFVDIFFRLKMIKDKLTDVWGSRLLPNDFTNILCEIRVAFSNRWRKGSAGAWHPRATLISHKAFLRLVHQEDGVPGVGRQM